MREWGISFSNIRIQKKADQLLVLNKYSIFEMEFRWRAKTIWKNQPVPAGHFTGGVTEKPYE
jgi:hypothetical protein